VRTAQAQGKEVIRANEFILDDEKGRTRAGLGMVNEGPTGDMPSGKSPDTVSKKDQG